MSYQGVRASPLAGIHFQSLFRGGPSRLRSASSPSSIAYTNRLKIAEPKMRRMVRIAEATTTSLISSARELIAEYSASLGIDLSFENFDEEMAEFPAHYTRPGGRILVAIEGGEVVGVVGLRS